MDDIKKKKAIIIGGILPIILYGLFALAVVGTSNGEVSEVATVHLGEIFGGGMGAFANLFAVFAMSTSFIALGLALKETYSYDYGISTKKAWLFTCIVPIAAFLFGVKSFIVIIGLAGALAGGLQGIMIVLMHRAAKKRSQRKPEYSLHDNPTISIALIIIFVVGIIYQLITSFYSF